jgi:hypothetical protein
VSDKPPKSGTEWLQQQRNRAQAADEPAAPVCNNEDALDSKIEHFLQQHGVKYAPKAMIPIELIDEKASLTNQARDVPLVPDAVDRYSASLRRGDYLPPILVIPHGNRVKIVDGNNRYAAHKRVGNRYVPGFVIAPDTSSEVVQLLTVAANRDNAESVPLRWRKIQAAGLIGIGYSQEQACEAAGIKSTQLTEFLALNRADARAKQHRVTHFSTKLAETTRTALGRIPLDAVFFQAARVAVEYEIDADTAKRVLREVKALSSENEQVAYVTQFAEEQRKARAAAGGNGAKRPRVSSPKTDFVSAAGKLLNVSTDALVRQTLTEHDRDALVRYCELMADKAVEVQIALEALKFGNDEEARRAS